MVDASESNTVRDNTFNDEPLPTQVAPQDGPPAPETRAALSPMKPITPQRNRTLYVLVPSIGKKRIVGIDASEPATQPKRARINATQPTKSPKQPRVDASGPSKKAEASLTQKTPVRKRITRPEIALHAATVRPSVSIPEATAPEHTTVSPFHQNTIVPMNSTSSRANIAHQPLRPPVPLAAKHLSDPPRTGPPKRKHSRPVIISDRESSVVRAMPSPLPSPLPPTAASPGQTAATTFMSGLAPPAQTTAVERNVSAQGLEMVVTDLFKEERKKATDIQKRCDDLQLQLLEGQKRESVLKVKVAGLAAESSNNRAMELRAEIARLKKGLESFQQQSEVWKRKERDHCEQISALTHEIITLKSSLENALRENEVIKTRAQESQKAVSEKELSMGGLMHMVGLAINNNMQVQNHHQPTLFTNGMGPMRGRANFRGRGVGRRFFTNGLPHKDFYRVRYPGQGSRDSSYQQFNHEPAWPSIESEGSPPYQRAGPSSSQGTGAPIYDHSRGRPRHQGRVSFREEGDAVARDLHIERRQSDDESERYPYERENDRHGGERGEYSPRRERETPPDSNNDDVMSMEDGRRDSRALSRRSMSRKPVFFPLLFHFILFKLIYFYTLYFSCLATLICIPGKW
ncbi:hypothetical protein K439DRAFT_942075 [Ramaria rubella]|nr:hypothetical protein K439DRAFT_942075 [Ramaria rubella]